MLKFGNQPRGAYGWAYGSTCGAVLRSLLGAHLERVGRGILSDLWAAMSHPLPAIAGRHRPWLQRGLRCDVRHGGTRASGGRTGGSEAGGRAQPLDLLGAAREAGRLFKLARLVVFGLLIICVGVMLVAAPDFRDDPRRVSTGDVVRSVAAGAAGVTVILLGWWQYRNARRAARPKAEPNAVPDTAR